MNCEKYVYDCKKYSRPVVRRIATTSDNCPIFSPEEDNINETSDVLQQHCRQITNEIKIQDLNKFISNTDEIRKEHESIPREKFYKCSIARSAENISKHRYYFCEAYDHNRVVLKVAMGDDDESDYIAASRVDSFNNYGRFIATQAPLPRTVNDFWRMVYQNKCTQIVTLSELFEEGLRKGHKYWPEEKSENFGNVAVNNYETKTYKDFDIRYYKVNGNEYNLQVEHYFYKEWPDHGVPDCHSFLNLLNAIKRSPAHQTINPVVVHCSAGAGRTGTLILIYNMIEMGAKLGKVDVYKHFLTLRTQRAYALESARQYEFVYKVLCEYFQ